MLGDWQQQLNRIRAVGAYWGCSFPEGASEQTVLEHMNNAKKYAVQIPAEFYVFCREMNGVSIDGLNLPGLCICDPDQFGRMDVLELNRYVNGRGDITILGARSGQFLGFDSATNSCVCVDSQTAEVIESFVGSGEMLTKVLGDKADELEAMFKDKMKIDGEIV